MSYHIYRLGFSIASQTFYSSQNDYNPNPTTRKEIFYQTLGTKLALALIS